MTAKASTPKANKPALKVIKSPKATKSPKVTKSVKTSEVEKAPKTNDSLKTGLDPALVEKAVDALLKYNEKQSGNSDKLALLGDDRAVQVQFTLQRSPGNRSPKPMRILIPHPLYKLADASTKENAEALEEPEICLIVKEESKAWVQEMINRFPDHMGCVKKVLGLQSLRKKHAQYEQRRELLAKYNIFMADDRILPMLSKALGKDFFKAKKLPIPITLTRKEALPFAIQKALSATFMTIPEGTCITVRAGHTGMSPQTLVDNVMAIAENAVPKIPRKWANIQVVALKTPESMALPIYNKTPETLLEIAAMAGYKPPKLSTSEDIDLAEKEFNGATKSSDSKADADKKRKGDLKSPLVRALKKQKKVEEEEKAGTKKADKKQASKQKRGAADVAVEDTPKESPTKKQKLQVAKKVEEVKPESTKKAKKETKVETPKDKKVEEVKPESTKKAKKETKVETPKETKKVAKKVEEVKPESAKKAKKETKVETPKETKKQKKDTPVKKSEEVKPKSAEKSKKEEENKNFIAAKKFKGSKKGYAFKMGKLGVGYYVDVKPTVDKMAIQAIMRLKNSRGGQKRNKYSK